MTNNLHIYVVVAQMPVVAFLIVANMQATRAFHSRAFLFVAAGWLANLCYLIAANLSRFGLLGIQPANEIWWLSAGDVLDIAAAYLFWLAYWHHRVAGKRSMAAVPVGIVFMLTACWQVLGAARIDPLTERLGFVLATTPSVAVSMFGLWGLRSFYVSATAPRTPTSGRHQILFSVGVSLYMLLQPLYLFSPFLPQTTPNVGFLLGGFAKILIALGLVAAFIVAAEIGVRMSEREERVRVLGATVGRLTHELATPIAQMTLHVDNLITAAPEHGAFSRHVRSLENAVLRVNAILATARQLLPQPEVALDLKQFSTAFQRIPQFQEEQVVSINNIVQLALMAVKETRDEQIITSIRYAGNCCIKCVPIEITQAVINVIRNAYDAYPKRRGKILVETANIRRHDTDDLVQIRITDNGEGISPDMLPHIFIEGVTTRSGGGRGYGLAVVRSMVERNAGTVELTSTAQGSASGTVVTLHFPRVACVS